LGLGSTRRPARPSVFRPSSSPCSPGRARCSTPRPSWLDRKECIVLDYSETSTLAQWIRDEIRLIEPLGLYLGKVYWNKARLFDFALQF
jgi:hypothetical protein